MNIYYISSIDISLPNGPGVNEREFVNTLQKECRRRGDHLCCLIPKPTGSVDAPLTNALFYKDETGGRRLTYYRLAINYLKLTAALLGRLPFRKNSLFILRLSSETLLVPFILQMLRKSYCIKTLEDIYGFASRNNSGLTRLNFWIKRFLLKVCLRKAIFIDACTHQLVSMYKTRFRLKNITYIDNAVNIERFNIQSRLESRRLCGLHSFQNIVGYCGGFPSQRGAAQLINIAHRLIQAIPSCGILIIGEDAELETLKRQVRKNKLGKRVIFKGIVPYEKLADYINCLDVGVALDTMEKVENVGNSSQKIRQYLACGVPFICPENTNLSMVAKELSISVPVNDLNAIYHAILYFLKRPAADIQQYRMKARNYATEALSTELIYAKRYQLWVRALKEKNVLNQNETLIL